MNLFRLITLGMTMAFCASAKLAPEEVSKLPPRAERLVDFRKDIQPILERSCLKCHGHGRSKGGFRIDSRETLVAGGDSGPALVPGKSAESYMVELVSGLDPDSVMPKKGTKLTPEQVGLFRAWIDQGAKWDGKVSFAKPAPMNLSPDRPPLPKGSRKFINPIDRFIDAQIRTNGLRWGARSSDAVFVRRVYLDVIGLLPKPSEVRAFLGDKRKDKRSRLVQELLGRDQDYAENWLTFWNDLLRNDYRGTGYIDGGRKQISGWLYAALASNLRYDEFVRQLVHPGKESEGFTKGIVWRGVVNASQTPQMQAAQNISQVFMGVNLKCASCHDSFINDWQLSDAYGLANVYADQALEMFQCDKPTGKKAPTKFIYPELGNLEWTTNREERLEGLARVMVNSKDGRLSRTIVNRFWAKLLGRGLVEQVDDMEQPSWNPALLNFLAEDFVSHGYDLKYLLGQILTSEAYQLVAVPITEQAMGDARFRGPIMRRMTAEQFVDAVADLSGTRRALPASPDFDLSLGEKRGERKSPQVIWAGATVEPGQAAYFSRKLELKERPARALVLVTAQGDYTLWINGKKILADPGKRNFKLLNVVTNFREGENWINIEAKAGTNGAPADGVVFYGDITAGDRREVLISDEGWRSGTNLVTGTGHDGSEGWSVRVLPKETVKGWDLKGRFPGRRALLERYGTIRSALVEADPLMLALGRPNREQVMTARASSATTLQALELTNGETLNRMLAKGADRWVRGEKTGEEVIEGIYGETLGRGPSRLEMADALELIGRPVRKEGVADFLWAVVMLPEFQLIY